MNVGRRTAIKAGLALGASLWVGSREIFAQSGPLIRKKIPSSGETIPIIGIGTARRYEEITNEADKAPLRETIRQFQALGGTVIDSSPSYGTAEAVVGELVEGLKIRDSLFLATKVSLRKVGREEGIRQIEESFKKYRTNKLDLIAVHNLRDTDTQLKTLREMKAAGRIRYVGITTSFDDPYGEFEQTMKKETLDFIQVDYALDNATPANGLSSGKRSRHGGDDQLAIRPRPAVQRGAGQEAARLGEGVRLRLLGAVLFEIYRFSSCGHLCRARHGPGGIRRRLLGVGLRVVAGCGDAQAHGKFYRQCLRLRRRSALLNHPPH